MSVESAPEVLDNPVWHSLAGPRRALGTVLDEAGCFDPDVAFFGGISDAAPPTAWEQLASIVGPGGGAALFRAEIGPPAGWTTDLEFAGLQMVAADVRAVDDRSLAELGSTDVREMLALVDATKPGPFFERTIEFGGYVGVRDGDRLVAMAGERMRLPGYTEISAVCTSPDRRGEGLATRLVLALVHRIRARGENAIIHCELTNTSAIRLYESLGFSARREMQAKLLRAPDHT